MHLDLSHLFQQYESIIKVTLFALLGANLALEFIKEHSRCSNLNLCINLLTDLWNFKKTELIFNSSMLKLSPVQKVKRKWSVNFSLTLLIFTLRAVRGFDLAAHFPLSTPQLKGLISSVFRSNHKLHRKDLDCWKNDLRWWVLIGRETQISGKYHRWCTVQWLWHFSMSRPFDQSDFLFRPRR